MKNIAYFIFVCCFIFSNTHAQVKPHRGVKSIDSLVQVINKENYPKFFPKELNKRSRSYDDSTIFFVDTASHLLKKVICKRVQHTAYRDTNVEVFYYSTGNGIHLVRIDYEFFNDCMAAMGTWYVKNNKVLQNDGHFDEQRFNSYLKKSSEYVRSFNSMYSNNGRK